jgi:hypothetical protein
MTSTHIGVFFSIKTNLYYRTSSLSIKHVDVLESINSWTSIITSLLHLTMIGTKKHGVGSEIGWDYSHYMMHQGLAS